MLGKRSFIVLLICCALGSGFWIAGVRCGGESTQREVSPPEIPSLETPAAEDFRYFEYEIGAADPCELLIAAGPQALLETELAPASRVLGLCRTEAKERVKGEPERYVSLELRREPLRSVPNDLAEFWQREGGGVDMLGGRREQIQVLHGIGDYALWYPSENGLQLYAYWDSHNVLVLTVAGAPLERALPWALDLTQKAIARARSVHE
jgi:hypothetical protein